MYAIATEQTFKKRFREKTCSGASDLAQIIPGLARISPCESELMFSTCSSSNGGMFLLSLAHDVKPSMCSWLTLSTVETSNFDVLISLLT